MLAEHSSRDLSDWQAFEAVYGFDVPVEHDRRFGMLIASVWNSTGGLPVDGSKEKRAARPEDFFARLTEPEPEHAEDEDESTAEITLDEAQRRTESLKAAFAAWGKAHNAAVRKAAEQGLPDDPEAN